METRLDGRRGEGSGKTKAEHAEKHGVAEVRGGGGYGSQTSCGSERSSCFGVGATASCSSYSK
ncbi:rhomboid family protein [Histoplasma capsulatum]|uniref:Rhomboid family protein n=1 Tax=Ajellomyces capsulatus TaxID=5037 RepID=A0A8A1LYQ6_AJECA|nr:rhomboid family protein [Histoplasma capsulatum]